MPPTQLTFLLNNEPLVGASIWLGEIGGLEKETDENGTVTFPSIVPPWEGYTEVRITGPVDASTKLLVVAGQTHVIDLGERTEP